MIIRTVRYPAGFLNKWRYPPPELLGSPAVAAFLSRVKIVAPLEEALCAKARPTCPALLVLDESDNHEAAVSLTLNSLVTTSWMC
jgi:hypothetical protein